MNNLANKTVAALVMVAMLELVSTNVALARGGGGSSFMNSPGYQRRLQESRGYVTDQSGSIVQRPEDTVRVHRPRKTKRPR